VKSTELARRLGVSDATVRNWSDRYAEFLSEQGGGLDFGATRRFTEEDALVMATVAQLRTEGLTHEAIGAAIRRGRRAERVPDLPTPEEVEARERVDLVPQAEIQRWIDQVAFLRGELADLASRYQAELDRLGAERDALMGDLKQERGERAALERQTGRLEGELEQVKIRLEEAQQRLDEAREELDAERNRKRGPFGLW